MEPTETINSVGEWLKLPEIDVRTLRSEREEGFVARVDKVAFLAASQADCTAVRSLSTVLAGDKCILPTAVIELNGEPLLHRLPVSLANWVIDCVALAKTGRKLFPTLVEFGDLHGRVFAELRPEAESK